jgi:general stress protein YciG
MGQKRGFAAMDPEEQRAIASMGGKTAHAMGRANEFTEEQAREAGRKGGKALAQDRAHMAEIGRRGGLARGRRKRADASPEEP